MNPRHLIGLGLYTGIGLGQMFAWLILHGDSSHAAGMTALSTFGPGMSITGALWIVWVFARGIRTN